MVNIPYKNLPPAINGIIRNAVGQAFDQLPINIGSVFPGLEAMAADAAVGNIRNLPGNFKGQLPDSLIDKLDQLIADQLAQLPFPITLPDNLGQMLIGRVESAMRNFLQRDDGASSGGGLPPRSEWPPGQMPIPLPGGRWAFVPDPGAGGSAPRTPKRLMGSGRTRPGEGPILGSELPAPDAPSAPKRVMGGKKSGASSSSSAIPVIIGVAAVGAIILMQKK